jgi:hypothetical protein
MRPAAEWLANAARRIAGIVAAMLPRRTWGALDLHVPVTSSAFTASLLTFLAGMAIGIPGFLDYASGQASMYIDLLMNAADQGKSPTRDMAVGMNAFALWTFLLLTPTGWATLYLASTGAVRSIAAWFDDPRGDALLSAADWAVGRVWHGGRIARASRRRERLEGPETRDIVVTGGRAGMPGADLVIIASRRKPGWDHDTIVITADATYRIGIITERTIDGRLRTLYPLTEHKDLETFRRTVRYNLTR